MILNYCFEPMTGAIDSPTEASIVECFDKLREEDFLILENAQGSFVQARRKSPDSYMVEYQLAGVQYSTVPETVERSAAQMSFITFLLCGPDSRDFQDSLLWSLSPFQPNIQQMVTQDTRDANCALELPHSNGIEFEEYVARTLQENDWLVRLTKKSGDQGLDVLARDEHYRVALQCKRYASPVGNSAIQEVHAAADFSGCTHAVVVTTSSFTSSANDLAEALDVVLLHEVQLSEMRSHLAFITPRTHRKAVSSVFRDF